MTINWKAAFAELEAMAEYGGVSGLLAKEWIRTFVVLGRKQPGRAAKLDVQLKAWTRYDEWKGLVTAMGKDGRPFKKVEIDLANGNLTFQLDKVIEALRQNDANLYQMTGRLIQLIHHNLQPPRAAEEVAAGESPITVTPLPRRPAGALILHEVGETLLTELITGVATFSRFDKRRSPPEGTDPNVKGAMVPTKTPPEFARHILARGQWPLRILRGTVETPTLRPDGTVLQVEGYDEASGLYLDLNGVTFPPIADEPTREEALAALDLLLDLVSTFPFVPGDGEEWVGPTAARSVALSAILTAPVRRSIATAPAHAIVAPMAGTGKTKLAEIAAAIATGRKPTAISYGKTQEEFEKRLFSVLRTGDSVVLIDNIEADAVSSDEFCTVLTSEHMKNRVLGLSRMDEVATNALFLLNGNNVVFKGDIVDRVIIANLDARMEHPKSRVFEREPVAYAVANRPALVAAALTILRAHAAAGYPGAAGLSPSRFPSWDKVIRGALVWLDQPDPQSTHERLTVSDPERETHAAVLHAVKDAIGLGVRVTAQELVDRAGIFDDEGAARFVWSNPWPEDAAAELDAALSNAVEGRALTPKRVGRYLIKCDGRVFDGLVMRVKPDAKRAATFWIERV